MKDFWKLYKHHLRDYPEVCRGVAVAFAEFAIGVFALTLPITIFIAYPVFMIIRRIKK